VKLSEYAQIFWRRWLSIAIMVLVAVSAATAFTFTQTPVYRASMKIVVGQGEGVFRAEFGGAVDEFTQTMSDLLESDVIARTVIENLDLETSPAEFLGNLNVGTKPSTAVLDVSYDDTSRGRGREVLQELGDVFTQLVRENLAGSNEEAGASRITASIFDPAHSEADPVSPRPLLNLTAAGAIGLVLGLLFALTREHFDDRLRGIEEVEQVFGEKNTSTLPPNFLGDLSPGPSVTGTSDRKRRSRVDPVLAELMTDRLRSDLLWPWEGDDPRTIVITSARAEEGKTTLAANLSIAIARAGHDVILLEADLRRPRLHEYLKLPTGPSSSLDMVLSGHRSVDEALMSIPIKWVAPQSLASEGVVRSTTATTRVRRNSGSLRAILAMPGQAVETSFSTSAVAELLGELHERAPIVVIDTPPLLSITDGYPFILQADVVVATIRNGQSTVASTQELRHVYGRLGVRDRVKTVVTEIDPPFDVAYGYVAPPQSRAAGKSASRASSGLIRVRTSQGEGESMVTRPASKVLGTDDETDSSDIESNAPASE